MKALAITGLVLLLLPLAACSGAAPATMTQTVTVTPVVTTTPTVTTTQTATTTQTVTAALTVTPTVTPTATPPATGENHEVIITGSGYNPAAITIKPGDSVTWVNQDTVSRTVTSMAIRVDAAGNSLRYYGEVFDSGDIAPGGAYTRIFDQAGLYNYVSMPLYLYIMEMITAMKGSVTVEEG